MKELNFNATDYDNGQACYHNLIELWRQKQFDDATDCAIEALGYLEHIQEAQGIVAHIYTLLGYYNGIIRGNRDLAIENYTRSLEHHILAYRKKNFADKNLDLDQQLHYKFVTADMTNIDSILSKIMLSHPDNFNDPMDCPCMYANEDLGMDKSIFDGLRISCFAKSDLYGKVPVPFDPYRWSMYANAHKGICIEYDLSDILSIIPNQYCCIKSVKYEDSYNRNSLHGGMVGSILTKSKMFVEENEFRLIWFDKSCNDRQSVFVNINPSIIKGIYFGWKCPKELREYVIQYFAADKTKYFANLKPSTDNFFRMECFDINA